MLYVYINTYLPSYNLVLLTRRMYWWRASIQDGQASASAWWPNRSETGFPW